MNIQTPDLVPLDGDYLMPLVDLSLDKNAEFSNSIENIDESNIICKMEPYNLCFYLDRNGKMRPIGAHRPVRVLRIYK